MLVNGDIPSFFECYRPFPLFSPYFSDPLLLFLMGPGQPLEAGQAPFAGTIHVGTDLWILAA